MKRHPFVTWTLFFVIPSTAHANFDAPDRIAHLRDALTAIASADPTTLEDTHSYLDVIDRNKCQSMFHRLKVECLIAAAKRNCRGRRGEEARRTCLLYSDVVVTNKLSEEHFVSTRDRYFIMKNHRNFRSELRKELHRRYGSLVAGFSLSAHARCEPKALGCLAAGINSYCVEYADTHSLSWQHCAAAAVWFIGTSSTFLDE